MKKLMKNPIFMFILGVTLTIGITSVLAYAFSADNIGFTPLDPFWKTLEGNDVNDVKTAIDDLHEKITNVEFVDLTLKTTPSNSCYNLQRTTAIIDRKNNEMYIRIYATKVIEDCNTNYTIDISSLNFASITYQRNLDLGNSTRYHFGNNTTNTTTLSFYVDTNYGYGTKQDYNYLVYYTYTK